VDFGLVTLLVGMAALGFRHGFDWDHIAAITDITSTTSASHTEANVSAGAPMPAHGHEPDEIRGHAHAHDAHGPGQGHGHDAAAVRILHYASRRFRTVEDWVLLATSAQRNGDDAIAAAAGRRAVALGQIVVRITNRGKVMGRRFHGHRFSPAFGYSRIGRREPR